MSAATVVPELDWRRLAESIADVWASRVPRLAALDVARNALHPFALGAPRGPHEVAERALEVITHRRDALGEPAWTGVSDAMADSLAADAVRAYLAAALDASLSSRVTHLLLGIECRRVSDGVWCGALRPLIVYAVRRDPGDWWVSIGAAMVADYDSRHALAIGTGATPEMAAFHALFRLPPAHRKSLLDRSHDRMYNETPHDASR